MVAIFTVVFPNADIKFFMTAKPEIRAQRRYKELVENGITISLDEVSKNIEERDYLILIAALVHWYKQTMLL
jgi:cytidylate kinase